MGRMSKNVPELPYDFFHPCCSRCKRKWKRYDLQRYILKRAPTRQDLEAFIQRAIVLGGDRETYIKYINGARLYISSKDLDVTRFAQALGVPREEAQMVSAKGREVLSFIMMGKKKHTKA